MANNIYIKSSQTDDAVQSAGSGFKVGEIAVNTFDGELYVAKGALTTPGGDSTGVATALMKHGGEMAGTLDMNNNHIVDVRNFNFNGGQTIASVTDEDDMSSNSSAAIATQQSIKAYVDNLPQWIQFPRMSVRMATQNYYYMGSKSLGLTIGSSDFVPSDFETTNVALLQNMQASDTLTNKVLQARIFCTYNGATTTDTVDVTYVRMRGAVTITGFSLHNQTSLTVSETVNQSMELVDDTFYHFSTTLDMEMLEGDIIVPVFRNVDAASKYLYYSIAYKVTHTYGY